MHKTSGWLCVHGCLYMYCTCVMLKADGRVRVRSVCVWPGMYVWQ